MSNIKTKDDPFWDLLGGGAFTATPARQLLSNTNSEDGTYYQTYEITLNIKQDKMSLVQHTEAYKMVWAHLINHFKAEGNYYIEQCASGQLHIHGFLRVLYTHNHTDDYLMTEAVARQIYLKLPRKYWKQISNATWHGAFSRWKAPALCINMKNILQSGWENYIQKNAPKN